MSKAIKVALVGNPNTGKTSIFNQLTGLKQKVGNYPGITVEKKEGICKLSNTDKAVILDLPGTYSLNTTSKDESIVVEVLLDKNGKSYPDVAIVIADVENLKRNLLLFTQIKDLGIPTLLVLNMADRMERKGIVIDIPNLEKELNTKIALVSARSGKGIEEIKELILNYKTLDNIPAVSISKLDEPYFKDLTNVFPKENSYKLWVLATQKLELSGEDKKIAASIIKKNTKTDSDLKRLQQKETILRYQYISAKLKDTYVIDRDLAKGFTATLDKVLTHKVFGYLIFLAILLLIFQAIYDWSAYPMDFIDESFATISEWTGTIMPPGVLTDLITEGIIPGIGGVVIFIPQIAFLFLFIALLEESGYMSRVVFLMDKLMRPFGLSGKSVVPLISGTACSIPAVMASRTIDNWKERLITILVVPFTTCAARLPVYLIIIALVIPDGDFVGFSYQALTLMLLYIIGFGSAIGSAWILKLMFKPNTKSFFMIEMPNYKLPLFKNVGYTVLEKTKSFVLGAGKIILAISIVLWFLATNGPTEEFTNATAIVNSKYTMETIPDEQALNEEIASHKLGNSYIGIAGKIIEPAIAPLGYDWKIGIALISSFAAREVFVGTLATIYSVDSENEDTIKNRMRAEIHPVTGEKVFNLASGISLLLFYAFALQCMSTLAIVKRELNSWKWPLLQLGIMSAIAYVIAMAAYQILK